MACMPWNKIDVMTEKERFIALAQSGLMCPEKSGHVILFQRGS
jgi:hypothetical protein